jgi:predicted nucleotidyltransferase
MLAKRLRGRAREAYVIGSYARGEADEDSDLDLVLVAETDLPWPQRGQAFLDLYELGLPLDLLVYAPSEWAQMRREGHPLFASRREWISIPLDPGRRAIASKG